MASASEIVAAIAGYPPHGYQPSGGARPPPPTTGSGVKPPTALSTQPGGTHYRDCAIQPVQYIEANRLRFLEGCIVKRATRHDKPTGKGREDLEKIIHEARLILELRYGGEVVA